MCRRDQLWGMFLCGCGSGILLACLLRPGFFLGCVGIGAIIGGIVFLRKC